VGFKLPVPDQLGGSMKRRREPTGLAVDVAVSVARVLASAEASVSASVNPEKRASAAQAVRPKGNFVEQHT
jgi:hypothetical protein